MIDAEDMLERAKEKMVGSRKKPGRKKQIFGLFEDHGRGELYDAPGAAPMVAEYSEDEMPRHRPGGAGSMSPHARGAAGKPSRD